MSSPPRVSRRESAASTKEPNRTATALPPEFPRKSPDRSPDFGAARRTMPVGRRCLNRASILQGGSYVEQGHGRRIPVVARWIPRAGGRSSPCLHCARRSARRRRRADVVLHWDEIAVRTLTTQVPALSPFAQSRFAAIVQLAVFEAVNATTGEYEGYLGSPMAPTAAPIVAAVGASSEAAAIAAAHDVLVNYFPGNAVDAQCRPRRLAGGDPRRRGQDQRHGRGRGGRGGADCRTRW